jgi:hypothetical protein
LELACRFLENVWTSALVREPYAQLKAYLKTKTYQNKAFVCRFSVVVVVVVVAVAVVGVGDGGCFTEAFGQ